MTVANFMLRLLTVASFSASKKHIDDITKTYFAGESLLFIYWSNESMKFRDQLMDYWMKFEIVTVETCNCDYVTDDINWERSFVQNTIVLFGDMIPERRHIENMRQCRSWNPRSKILAIVNDSYNIANITLDHIWKLTKAINVTVKVSSTSSTRFFTMYPYDKFKIVELDQKLLFPSKPLNNLYGSLIHVAMAASPPNVVPPIIPNVYSDGIEFRMVNVLAEKLKFRWEVFKLPAGQSPYVVMKNGKAVGNFGALYRCEADIAAFGAQIRIDRYVLADYTAIHTMDKMVWVVPVRPFSFTWRSIIIVFQKDLWGLLFSTLILITLTLYVIIKYEFGSREISYNVFDAIFQTFGIHLGVPIYFYRKRQLYRLFIFGISYYTIIIIALYQSSLITYLTTPGSGTQYKTIGEAVDDGLIGYIYPSGKPSYNLTDHDLWNKILSPGRHVYNENSAVMMSMVAYNNCYTLMVNNIALFNIQKSLLDENHKPMVNVLPETFLPYMGSIFTSKGHPLRDVIKDLVLKLFESGMLIHWMRDVLLKNSKIYRKSEGSRSDGPSPLSMEQLKGPFYILPLLFMVAGIVFMVEIGYYWYKARNERRLF